MSNLAHDLAALRQELEHLQTEPAAKARLEELIAKIEADLNTPHSSADDHGGYGLTELVERFEVSHPELTKVLNRLMLTLSNMGI